MVMQSNTEATETLVLLPNFLCLSLFVGRKLSLADQFCSFSNANNFTFKFKQV
jgi:hypothetical protein